MTARVAYLTMAADGPIVLPAPDPLDPKTDERDSPADGNSEYLRPTST
ncbi:MAG: hypothetical protein LC799_28130 [Actinobacteria bacterium]|nr:hypothetical protein [Actinomycetota bacterium]